jgi:hypothetical protein
MTHRPVGAKLFLAEGQTGITMETVAFYTFVKSHNTIWLYILLIIVLVLISQLTTEEIKTQENFT